MRKVLLSLVLLLLAAGGPAYWHWFHQPRQRTQYRTALVERRPFLAFITASGPLQPVDSIDVGAQVAGRIERFGIDPRHHSLICSDALRVLSRDGGLLLSACVPFKSINYGSPVEKGTILAQIDDELYRNDVDLASADLDKAHAELQELENKQIQIDSDWTRAKDLYLRKALSQAEYDAARGAYTTTHDRVNVAKAVVKRAEGLLAKADKNLGYTTIRSPVKGIIVDRRVNMGQTVVASLNAPSLFLIATDLRKLQIWASVNEADIGQIWPGQEVRFSVDANPREEFAGYVAEDQPRLNASMTQNVVTYTVVADVDNVAMKLKPYMTANVRFVLHKTASALLVANAALRWRPQLQQVVAEEREAFRNAQKPRRQSQDSGDQQTTVWIEEQGLVRPVHVKIGLSDGVYTEVLEGNLDDGDLVVTGEANKGDSNGANPFAPSMYGGKKQ